MGLIAGPCAIEEPDRLFKIAHGVAREASENGLGAVFKASFDKANRTRHDSYRGPGLIEGLALLREVRKQTGLRITTDVHLPSQVGPVAEVADLLQVPAFLCRQTDLLVEAGRSGRPVNIKKGQFMAPEDMGHAVDKLRHGGASDIIVTERGTTFGYRDLVVDMRSIVQLKDLGVTVCFDATHSVQQPGAAGGSSGGDRRFVPALCKAALAAGADVLFLEVHDAPDQARSDPDTQWPLHQLGQLLRDVHPYSAKP